MDWSVADYQDRQDRTVELLKLAVAAQKRNYADRLLECTIDQRIEEISLRAQRKPETAGALVRRTALRQQGLCPIRAGS